MTKYYQINYTLKRNKKVIAEFVFTCSHSVTLGISQGTAARSGKESADTQDTLLFLR